LAVSFAARNYVRQRRRQPHVGDLPRLTPG
jgi:hypothetical protein